MSLATASTPMSFKERMNSESIALKVQRLELRIEQLIDQVGIQEDLYQQKLDNIELLIHQRVVDCEEASKYLKLSISGVRKAFQEGRLTGYKEGKSWKTTMADLLAFVRKKTKNPEYSIHEMIQFKL